MKRKAFPRSDISAPRVEHERADDGEVTLRVEAIPPSTTKVRFSKATEGGETFDFARWYGSGIDQIVYACQRQIERFLVRQDAEVSRATILTYCSNGLKTFLNYLQVLSAARRRELTLQQIDRTVIDGYLGFLRDMGIKTTAQKSNYGATKAVLVALCRRGLIVEVLAGDQATFPSNPFPGVHRKVKGERPLPLRERMAFSIAVKTAVMPIFSDDVEPTSELLSYALFIIALHTGRNTWPLLEMRTDCLRAHPKGSTYFLVLYKRRGHAESRVAIRSEQAGDIEAMPTVRPTVAALIRRVIHLSDRLRLEAPPHLKDAVWLYRMRSPSWGRGTIGEVRELNLDMLSRSAGLLAKRYKLVDADGNPTRINVSRLRKTFVNRVYEILEGDVAATAVAAGNTIKVATESYLRPGENAQKNWQFMGRAMVEELLTNKIGATERTPVGRCSDTRHGEYAPKRDGSVCMSFFNCLRCRNYVVTGDDLYKVFSFYWRLLRERARMAPTRWKRQFAHVVRLIERDVAEAGVAQGVFKQAEVDSARERARRDPHPFWRLDSVVAHLMEAHP